MSQPSERRFRTILGVVLLSAPFWTRSIRHRLARGALALAYAYVGMVLMLVWLETWFLYHPTPASENWAPPPANLHAEDVEMTSSDGTKLHGWWARPLLWQPADGAVLVFHGNDGNVSHRAAGV